MALALGTAGLVTSVFVHQHWGHGPDTVHPLDFRGLMAEHEAFTVAAILLALGFALTVRNRRK